MSIADYGDEIDCVGERQGTPTDRLYGLEHRFDRAAQLSHVSSLGGVGL